MTDTGRSEQMEEKPSAGAVLDSKRPSGSRAVAVLKYVAAAGILLWLYHVGLIDFSPVTFLVHKPALLLALLFMTWLTFPLCALRWQMLLRSQAIDMTGRDIFRVVYLGAFAGLFLPGMVGGDIIRTVLGKRTSAAGTATIAMTVVMDRLLGICALLTLGVVSSFFLFSTFPDQAGMSRLPTHLLTLASLAVLLLAVLFWIVHRFSARPAASGTSRQESSSSLRNVLKPDAFKRLGTTTMIVALALSLVIQGKDLFILFLVAQATGFGELGLLANFTAGIASFLAQIVPLTPGGLGVGEAVYGQTANLLLSDGTPSSYGSVMLAFRVLSVLSVLPSVFLLPRSTPGG